MAELVVNPLASEVDWTSKTSYLFFNPRSPLSQIEIFKSVSAQILNEESYVWLFTSGSESFPKCVGLKKSAILSGAEALAKRFSFQAEETWINCLPPFHIGGLAIWARAHISGQNVIESTWDLDKLKTLFRTWAPHWMSLVPTQIYDVIREDLRAPNSLKGVFVGGGALHPDLDRQAKALGWPVLTTYGMTEASSQIATRTIQSSELEVLDHIEVVTDSDGRLGICGASVTDKIAFFKETRWELCDPRDENKVYWTQDRVELKNKILRPLGRRDDLKKTRGELVSQFLLQSRLDDVLKSVSHPLGAVMFFKKDIRLGHKICLVVEGKDDKEKIIESAVKIKQAFNLKSVGFEKIEEVYIVPTLPRSALGKFQYKNLEELLRNVEPFELGT